MGIRKCNITALIFLWALNVGMSLISMEFQCKHDIPTHKERLQLINKYLMLNLSNFFVLELKL